MKRLPVIEVITHLPLGGAQRVALTLAERLDRNRFSPYLVAGPRGDWVSRAENIDGCPFYPMPDLKRELDPRADASALAALVKLIRRIRKENGGGPLILHSHAPKAGVLGRYAARMVGAHPVHTLHGLPFYSGQKRLKRLAYRFFERAGYLSGGDVVSVTEINRELLISMRWVKPERCIVIPPCIDLDHLRKRTGPRERLAAHGIREEERVVGMVASLKPPKDPILFVRAAARLLETRTEWKAVLAGGGEMEPAVRSVISEMGMEDRILVLGWTDTIETLYPELDMLVLASHSEGLPLTLAEAMTCGVPVVATDVGGISEIVSEGKTGLLVPDGDEDALSAAMARLADNADLAKSLTESALQMVDRYRPEEMVAAYERFFESIGSGAGRTA